MKKIFITLFLSLLSFNIIFADYMPTEKDRQTISWAKNILKNLPEEKIFEIKNKIPKILEKLNENSKNYFLISEIYKIIIEIEENKVKYEIFSNLDKKLEILNNNILNEKELTILVKAIYEKPTDEDLKYLEKELNSINNFDDIKLKEYELEIWNKILNFKGIKSSKEYKILNSIYESILIKKLNWKNWPLSRDYNYDKEKYECYTKSIFNPNIKIFVNPNIHCKNQIEFFKKVEEDIKNTKEIKNQKTNQIFENEKEKYNNTIEELKEKQKEIDKNLEKIDKEIKNDLNKIKTYYIWPKWWCFYLENWIKFYVERYKCN